MLGFSGNLTGFKVFNYWVRKADDLLVGRFLGSQALGLYTRAYQVMLFPLQRISRVIGKVMFPALSKIQDDKERAKRAYLRSISIIALLTFPMMLGLLVTAEHLVLAILGAQWEGIIVLLRFLAVVGMAQSIGTTTGWIFQSQGKTDWQFRWGIVSGVITIVAFIIGIRWGLLGIVVAYTIRSFPINFLVSFFIVGRLINMSLSEVIKSVSGIFACASLMVSVVWPLGLFLPESYSHWLYILIQVPTGVVVYFLLVNLFRLDAYMDSVNLLREQWKQMR